MARHVWSVLCSRTIIDKESNSLSLFHVIEQVRVMEDIASLEAKKQEHPDAGIMLEYDLVSFWVRSDPEIPESVTCRVKIVTPSGKETATPNFLIALAGEAKRFRQKAHLVGFPYDGFGYYWFNVEYDAPDGPEVVARIPVEVIHAEPPEAHALEPPK